MSLCRCKAHTHTTDRKLQLHLGQFSPVIRPDSAVAAQWERKTLHNSSHTSFSPLFSLTFQLFTIFSLFSLVLSMLFLASSFPHILTNFCRSQQAFFVGVSIYNVGTNTHSHKHHTRSFRYFWIWYIDNLGAVWSPCLSVWEQKNANSCIMPHLGC